MSITHIELLEKIPNPAHRSELMCTRILVIHKTIFKSICIWKSRRAALV